MRVFIILPILEVSLCNPWNARL